MHRSVLALTMTLLAAGAARAEEPWLPLAEGKRWSYVVKITTRAAVVSTTKEGTATLTCGALDGAAHRVDWRLDDGEQRAAWVRADAGSVTVEKAANDGLLLLPFQSEQPGAVRESSVTVNGRPLALSELAVKGVERVTTPAGTYDALRVEHGARAAGVTKVRTSVWYARGVGPVKVVQVSEAPATRVEKELLLKEVTGGSTPAAGGGGGKTTPPPAPEAPAAGGAAPVAGGLAALVREAAAKGPGADLGRLRAVAGEVLRRAEKAAGRRGAQPAWDWVGDAGALRPTISRKVEIATSIERCVIVCDGDVEIVGAVRESVIVCTGRLEVGGRVDGSLVLALGAVQVGGRVEGSVVAVAGSLQVTGRFESAVVQAAQVQNLGRREDSTFVEAGPDDLLTPLR